MNWGRAIWWAGGAAAGVMVAVSAVVGQDYMNRRYREIEPSQPFYLDRKGKAWEGRTRIVGSIRNRPAQFTLTVINPLTKQGVTEIHSGAFTVYETQWLVPGRYDLVYACEGFMNQRVLGVQLRARSDCVIDVFFDPTVYKGK